MSEIKANIDVEKDVRAIVAEILEMEPGEIDPNANFVKDLGMDSMMALEVLASIEKKYRIIITEENLPKFTDLNTTTRIVREVLKNSNKL